MTIFDLAVASIEACEAEGIDHMLTGAFATSCYGIPRSTKDIDLVLAIHSPRALQGVIGRLKPDVEFSEQVQFDTLTWGKRHIGQTCGHPYLKVELFELFDDPFVQEQFSRRVKLKVGPLRREAYVPTAEDVIVQKLRWARDKDLIDAADVLIVQGPESLDMDYVRKWCHTHGSEGRLADALVKVS